MPPYGMARTELTAATEATYEASIERLGDAMRIARQLRRHQGHRGRAAAAPEPARPARREAGAIPQRSVGCVRVRTEDADARRRTLAQGPVICGVCGTEFTTGAEVRQEVEARRRARATVDDSFVARRREALRSPSDDQHLRGGCSEDQGRASHRRVDDPSAVVRRHGRSDAHAASRPDRGRHRRARRRAARRIQRRPVRRSAAVDGRVAALVRRTTARSTSARWSPPTTVEQEELASRCEGCPPPRRLDPRARTSTSVRSMSPSATASSCVDHLHDGPPLGTLGDVVAVDHDSESVHGRLRDLGHPGGRPRLAKPRARSAMTTPSSTSRNPSTRPLALQAERAAGDGPGASSRERATPTARRRLRLRPSGVAGVPGALAAAAERRRAAAGTSTARRRPSTLGFAVGCTPPPPTRARSRRGGDAGPTPTSPSAPATRAASSSSTSIPATAATPPSTGSLDEHGTLPPGRTVAHRWRRQPPLLPPSRPQGRERRRPASRRRPRHPR